MSFFYDLFTSNAETISWWAMAIRSVIVFLFAILIVRLGNRRFFGKDSVFDIVFGLMWGSLLSRAISGNAPFFSVLLSAAVMVLLHWFLSYISYRVRHIGSVFKGRFKQIIKDGEVQENEMRKLSISENDLKEWLRSRGKVTDPKQVKEAYFERDGTISVIPKKELIIREIKVSEGVQTVRIEFEK